MKPTIPHEELRRLRNDPAFRAFLKYLHELELLESTSAIYEPTDTTSHVGRGRAQMVHEIRETCEGTSRTVQSLERNKLHGTST